MHPFAASCMTLVSIAGTVLVSYSYFEKDETQLENANFFLKVGMGVGSAFKTPRHTEFAMVVQGRHCK